MSSEELLAIRDVVARPAATVAGAKRTHRTHRLVFLTNALPGYRVTTFEALERRVDALTLLVSGHEVAPGYDDSKLDVGIVKSLKIPLKRRHPSGYSEPYEVHLPLGLLGQLRAFRPDAIVAAEMGLRSAIAVLYRNFVNRSCALLVHADLSEHTELGRGRLRWLIRRAMVPFVDGFLVNGESGARYMQRLGVPRNRIRLFPYATDVGLFGGTPSADVTDPVLRLLYVGRVVELKGLEPFVARLAEVLARRPEQQVEMVIAGDGDRRQALAEMPLPPNLRLTLCGQVSYERLPATYRRAHAFVMPTLGDTWGLVVNEAMASGRPVIGSHRSQAVTELVKPEYDCGWQFDPNDADSMMGAITKLLDTPRGRLAEMGQRAREVALRISPDAVAERLLDAIDEMRRSARAR